jgi:hypothetical protein
MPRLQTTRTHAALRIAALFALGASLALPLAAAEPSQEELAAELTTLMRSGRMVISDNQEKINDAAVGDKGLSADKVLAAAKDNYKKNAGKALPTPAPGGLEERSQKAMLESMTEVMSKNQALINEKGKGYKGFLPAVFARQVAEAFTTKMKGEITVKLTAPKELIRNRTNRPDEWEHSVFVQQFKKVGYIKGKPYSAEVGNSYRYMVPEYYGDTCLKCHGEPKGEKDISGGLKEGAKLGDLGGAVSLTIPKK